MYLKRYVPVFGVLLHTWAIMENTWQCYEIYCMSLPTSMHVFSSLLGAVWVFMPTFLITRVNFILLNWVLFPYYSNTDRKSGHMPDIFAWSEQFKFSGWILFLTHLLWCCLVHQRVIRLLLPILEKSQPATAICLVQISKTVKTCGEWAEERDTTLRFVIWICILWTLRREVTGMLQICSKYGKPCQPCGYIPAEKLCLHVCSYLERFDQVNYASIEVSFLVGCCTMSFVIGAWNFNTT